jgi:hypothetical protein
MNSVLYRVLCTPSVTPKTLPPPLPLLVPFGNFLRLAFASPLPSSLEGSLCGCVVADGRAGGGPEPVATTTKKTGLRYIYSSFMYWVYLCSEGVKVWYSCTVSTVLLVWRHAGMEGYWCWGMHGPIEHIRHRSQSDFFAAGFFHEFRSN